MQPAIEVLTEPDVAFAMTLPIDLSRLTGVPLTLLLPLYYRAVDACQRVPLLGDPAAGLILKRLQYDPALLTGASHDRVMVMMRAREFDRRTRAFLAMHPNATIIELGCGLDTRCYRVDDGCAWWYEVDLPEVIDLRREVLSEFSRCRFIASSVLDFSWMDLIPEPVASAVLVLAEGLLMHFEDDQVRSLVRALGARFPGSHLICDVFSRFFVRLSPWLHPVLRRVHAMPRWGIERSTDPESWGGQIRLIEEWTCFDRPESRLGLMQLLRFVPPIANGARVLHLQLGPAPTSRSDP